MFSWLNFEELLIHNPIELMNPSKDTISVAMSKKQYIEFFSNKYTYNGLYYDEAMDFCLFYYADPLQSYKEGDVYAQGYIDVEMKIYRVKVLSNVSMLKGSEMVKKWAVTKTGMLVSPQAKQITMVQAGALMKCEINNNISGWTDGTTQLNYSGQDFVIDGYGMRGLHNG
ncbi:capsid and scaffold protein [Lactococcus phage BIM BV-114]|nr:capsid and scaffold protein [Lactococcus phage BIM BV-114]